MLVFKQLLEPLRDSRSFSSELKQLSLQTGNTDNYGHLMAKELLFKFLAVWLLPHGILFDSGTTKESVYRRNANTQLPVINSPCNERTSKEWQNGIALSLQFIQNYLDLVVLVIEVRTKQENTILNGLCIG
jgi:hypothetical protein